MVLIAGLLCSLPAIGDTTDVSVSDAEVFTGATIPVTVAANTASGPDLTVKMLLDGATGVGPAPAFAAQQTFATGNSPRSVTAADVNGDGSVRGHLLSAAPYTRIG